MSRTLTQISASTNLAIKASIDSCLFQDSAGSEVLYDATFDDNDILPKLARSDRSPNHSLYSFCITKESLIYSVRVMC